MKHINLCTATGLLYVDEVPLTQETLKTLKTMIDYGKKIKQFDIDVIVHDNVNESITLITTEVLDEIDAYLSQRNITVDMLAENSDF